MNNDEKRKLINDLDQISEPQKSYFLGVAAGMTAHAALSGAKQDAATKPDHPAAQD
jgi:hypothetical protein